MIELLKGFPDNVVAVSCKGRVTKQDYDTVLVPAVEKALAAHDKVRLYYEAGPSFAGIDPAAAWEDFKVGMAHFARWQRVAVVTDVDWIKHTMQLFRFIMPGDARIPDGRSWASPNVDKRGVIPLREVHRACVAVRAGLNGLDCRGDRFSET